MAKNDNAHALRLYESLSRLDGEAANEFAEAHPLSKSADFMKKFAWAKAQCAFLEERFSPEEVQAVRERCHCESGKGTAEKLRGYLEKSEDIREACRRWNSREGFLRLEPVEDGILMIFPRCYCSCVKRTEEPVSRTWCLCTLGYAGEMFSAVFERPIEVQLVETVKSGGERCVIKAII